MHQFRTCTLAIFAAGLVGTANAGDSYVLADLINDDGTVTVGDKLFSDFTYAFTGDMPDASGINVIEITDDLRRKFHVFVRVRTEVLARRDHGMVGTHETNGQEDFFVSPLLE